MKNIDTEPDSGVSFPILYVRRSSRLHNMLMKEGGGSHNRMDLTIGQIDDGDSDFVEDVTKFDSLVKEGSGKLRKRKIHETEYCRRNVLGRKAKLQSVGKLQKGVDAGLFKKDRRKEVRHCIVSEKQGGDDGMLKKGFGKNRLVISEDKGTGKVVDEGNLDNGKVPDVDDVVSKSGCRPKATKGKVTDKGKGGDVVSKKGNNRCQGGKQDDVVRTRPVIDRIHVRVSLWSLHRLIPTLSVKQREDVVEMGFGAVLGFSIKDVPTRLSYWLLDNFNEDERVLNCYGTPISITRETVRDILGLPMGNQVVIATEEADYRHPIVIEWKAQFGKKDRYLYKPVEQIMYTQQEGGWMFKLNFLVLYFTSIGESNKNSIVNLRFLPCINNENDIPKLDWCSYIVECLVKTKRNWVRTTHYTGPAIVLLVLYAHSMKPRAEDDEAELPLVNNWTVDLLNQLEDDMVRVEAVKEKVSSMYKMASDLMEEADEMLDIAVAQNPPFADLAGLKDFRECLFGPRRYNQKPKGSEEEKEEPTNAKRCTPKTSHKKGEPTDSVSRTPKASPVMDQNCKDPNEPYPYTQVYGTPSAFVAYCEEVELERSKQTKYSRRLPEAFDDIPSFDLKLTQLIAETTKSAGLSKGDDCIGETQKLIDSLPFYDSQEASDVYQTPVHGKNVPVGTGVPENVSSVGSKCDKMGSRTVSRYNICDATPIQTILPKAENARSRRNVKPGLVMCSPYTRRVVALKAPTTSHEQRVADCLFSGRFAETDILFKANSVRGPRGVLESLCPGVLIASGVIDIFTRILNHAEKFRDPLKQMQKVFCDTTMVNEWDVYGADEKERDVTQSSNRFIQNMWNTLRTTVYGSLDNAELVFFPVIQGRHFYVVCMHMRRKEVHILDNASSSITDVSDRYGDVVDFLVARFEDFLARANHPVQGQLRNVEWKILSLGCMTKQNSVDCGVFAMRHMETYLGGGEYDDLCGLRRESKEQQVQLDDLRIKYAAKILLSDINEAKSAFEMEADAYKDLPLQEKQRLGADAFERVQARVTRML